MPLDGAPGQEGQGEGAAAPQIHDEQSAAVALEGLLDLEDSGIAGDTESGASAHDAGEGESLPTGDDEEGHSETQETPASIEPPKSWSDEDKALFGKLPPEAQRVVAQRESQREAAFTRRTQEIADERKAWDAERQAIAGQRQQYLTSLQQLVHVALPEAQAFAQVDWAKLSTDNPAEYVRLSAQRDQLRERVGRITTEIQRVGGEAQAEQQRLYQGFLADQRKLLAEKIPEFGDAEKGKKLAGDLSQWLQSQGFTGEEIGRVADHRLVSLAIRAMRADAVQAARMTAEQKRSNTPPTVQRPGAREGSDDAATRRVQGQAQQFRRTGSVRDAALLLENFV